MRERPVFMPVKDVAARLGLSRNRVYALLKAGRLPAYREGRAIRVPREAFDAWMQGRVAEALASVRRGAATAAAD